MQKPNQAQRAEDFINSVGVNTHIGYTGTIYGNVPIALQDLSYLGISHVRDQQPFDFNISAYQTLANHGIKFDLYIGGPGNDFAKDLPNLLPMIDAFALSNPSAVFSLEGPNEINGGNPVYYNGVSSASSGVIADQVMQAISSAVHSVASLANVPVLNASLGGNSNYLSYGQQEGDMSAYVDGANSHDYFYNGEQPSGGLTYAAQLARSVAPGKPLTFTESGYFTAYQDASGWGGVDQMTQAKNTLNLLADAYQLGAQQIYLYELGEGVADPSTTDIENTFGLFTADGTPKLAAVAIHNLTSILSDTAGNAQSFTAGSLSYTIDNLPQTGNSMLLEKANNAFDLMLWNEAPDWNPTSRTPIAVSPTSTTVAFGQTYTKVEVFDPMQGSSPIQTLKNVDKVTIELADHPVIVQIEAEGGAVAVTNPSPVAPQTAGPDTLILNLSEDAYLGDAQARITLDGKTLGDAQTVAALHAKGQTSAFVFHGTFGSGTHTVGVSFLNDAYGGSPVTDRNLYIDSATFNGTAFGTPTTLGSASTVNLTVAAGAAPPSTHELNLAIAEDAWIGDAQFTVSLDGTQLGGTRTAHASHTGADEQVLLSGQWGAGAHTVTLSFINDAYGGTSITDRNLYLDGATYDGELAANTTHVFYNNGAWTFTVGSNTPSQPSTSTLAIHLSEDAYMGDAQVQLTLDGKPLGTAAVVTALHAANKTQDLFFPDIAQGPHQLGVAFMNDLYAGTPATDRNLYVDSIEYAGHTTPGAALWSTGTHTFTVG